jgi:PAS domain S-box-containing protein
VIENTVDFHTLFEALPGNYLVVLPDIPLFTIVAASDQYLHTTNTRREHIVGKSIFEAFPENPDAITATGPSNVRMSLQNAFHTKKPDQMPVIRYDVPNEAGVFEERYWAASHKPVLNGAGEVAYIVQIPMDVTSQVKADKQESTLRQIEKTYNLFMQAPVAVCIVSGPENMVELANGEMHQLLGRTADIVGKPLFESLPEAKAQGFPAILDQVRKTGEAIYATQHPTTVLINGKADKRFFNFVYQPYYPNTGDKRAAGVFIVAHDVTQQVTSQKQLAYQKNYLENAIAIADLATFYIDVATNTGSYSEKAKEWFGLEGLQHPLDVIFSKVHPEDAQRVIASLSNSLQSIEKSRHDFTYRLLPADSHAPPRYLRSMGKVIFEEGKAHSIIGIIQDVTPQIVSQLTLKESESHFRSLIEESPVATCLFTGRDLVIDVANQAMIELWGKGDSLLGKPLREALPELEGQPSLQILDDVYTSGKPYEAQNAKVMLVVNGVPGLYYFNFTYKPLFDAAGQVYGILDTAIDVTEQVLSRRKIEESELFARSIIENTTAGQAVWLGEDMVFEVVNEMMLEILGRDASIIGKPFMEAIPELKDTPLLERLRRVLHTGKSYFEPEERFVLMRHGQPYVGYYNYTYKALGNAAGENYGVICTAVEVTEQVLSRKKAEENAAKYQSLFESIDQGFCLIDMLFDEHNRPIDYRFLEVNPTFEQQTGLQDAGGKTMRELVPDLEAHWFEIYGKVALTGEPIRFVEGSQVMNRWFDVYAFRVSEGESRKVALLFTDISQRRQAEEALKESESQLKFAIEATELATWDYNPSTNQFRGNSRLKEWFGLPPQEEIDLSVAIDVMAPTDRDRVTKAIGESLQYASGGLYDIEYTIIHPITQKERIVRAKGRAWFKEDKMAYRFNGTLQDVTRESLAKQTLQASEQRAQQLAQELAAANEELQAANEEIQSTNEELEISNVNLTRTNVDLDNFIYTASHDLKAPISNIESLLQALLRSVPAETLSSGRAGRITDMMQESVERFKKTIANLTDVVKLQKESEEESVLVNLSAVIREVSLDLEPMIKSSGAQVEVDVSECPAVHFSEKNLLLWYITCFPMP